MSIDPILAEQSIFAEYQQMKKEKIRTEFQTIIINSHNIDPQTIKLLPVRLLRRHEIFPVEIKNGRLILAMANPLNYNAVDDVRIYTGMEVMPVLASQEEILTAIRQFSALLIDPALEKLVTEVKETEITDKALQITTPEIDDTAPIIRLADSIVEQAVQSRASDIHIEPQDNNLRIRIRIDGHLYELLLLPLKIYPPLISRLKIMSNLDIAEKRIPQDGRIKLIIDKKEIDFRVSTLPSVTGEKIVLRILDRSIALRGIDEIGFDYENLNKIRALLARPHGMLLVTGPTGSGKTTTMYSFLQYLNVSDKNIVTLEDPVEYSLPGINQVQINHKAGLTFPVGLRSLVRQDPDIIMVGEIRDRETAELGVRSAITGHLLFSTLHTNSAIGTITRLLDMGIESYLLTSAIIGIVSQRLVRRLCPNCRQSYLLDKETALKLGLTAQELKFYKAKGCNMCRHTGYAGRIALHEVLEIGPIMRQVINKGQTSEDLLESTALKSGMLTIKTDGLRKAQAGITSLEELLKVIYLGG